MRFNCGPSIGEWYDARLRRQRDWHLWFAWRPVRIEDSMCVWWEYIERRNDGPSCMDGWDEWKYRWPETGA